MRIALVGHGRLPIPPTHWGAVEAIADDYRFWCERFGHDVLVVNEKNPETAIGAAWHFRPDVIHLHDESKIDALATISGPLKIVTTHDPTFFDKPNPFIPRFVRGDFLIGCLTRAQAQQFFQRGVPPERILYCPNGARSDLVWFSPTPKYPDRMVCLGMVGQRKRQDLLFPLDFVDCIGPIASYDPVELPPGRVFDSWSKQEVYDKLTDYAALVLLSRAEADPLVVKEALMAGLTVIASEAAAAGIDRSQPFVHVLDEQTINTPVAIAIKLRTTHCYDRCAVRAYAEQNFDWSVLVKQYLTTCFRLLRQKTQLHRSHASAVTG